MPYPRRLPILRELERITNSRVLTLVTSDREPVEIFAGQIAQDCIVRLGEHLEAFGDQPTISLFLYSRGGDTNVPWRIVTLVRQYCSAFHVLIPFRAHSAATMIALGADKIRSGSLAELSPVDPSIRTTDLRGQQLTVGVEDVIGFINLAKEKVGLRDQAGSAEILKALAGIVHPVLLGSVNRTHSLIRLYVKNLLELHTPSGLWGAVRKRRILRYLTERLFSHGYVIGREEAKRKIGLKVEFASPELERTMWRLFEDYAQDMELDRMLSPTATNYDSQRAFVESTNLSHVFLTRYANFTIDQQGAVTGTIAFQEWVRSQPPTGGTP